MRTASLVPVLALLGLAPGCQSTASPAPVTADPASTTATAAAAATATTTASASPSPSAPTAPPPETTTPASSPMISNDFTMRFYKQARPAKGNAFYSGTSLRTALGMAYLGARGETASEMAKAFGFEEPERVAADAKAEAAAWDAARGSSELAIANRLWVEKAFPLEADFTRRTTSGYGASASPIDFSGAPEPSRKAINAWVSEQTKAKIPELLPAGSLTPLTRLVITNAIYFKGSWARPFTPASTHPEPFAIEGGAKESVPMMHQTSTFALGSAAGAKVLELPYAKSDLAMDIVLPDDPAGLARLEASLSNDTLSAWTKSLAPQNVKVSLPKLTFRGGGSVKPHLQALGMKRAFSPQSDFGAMSTKEELAVSDVFHQTFVAIDEVGTEAAAATAVVMATRGMAPAPPPEFKADRPFLFLIRDTKQGRILFLGRVTNPKG